MSEPSNHDKITPVEARQGQKAPMVRRMLVISTLVAIIAIAVIAYFATQ